MICDKDLRIMVGQVLHDVHAGMISLNNVTAPVRKGTQVLILANSDVHCVRTMQHLSTAMADLAMIRDQLK